MDRGRLSEFHGLLRGKVGSPVLFIHLDPDACLDSGKPLGCLPVLSVRRKPEDGSERFGVGYRNLCPRRYPEVEFPAGWMSVVQILVAHPQVNVEDAVLVSRILRDGTERSDYRGSVLLGDLVAEEVERRALLGKDLDGAIEFRSHYAEHVDRCVCGLDKQEERDCAQHDPFELID